MGQEIDNRDGTWDRERRGMQVESVCTLYIVRCIECFCAHMHVGLQLILMLTYANVAHAADCKFIFTGS